MSAKGRRVLAHLTFLFVSIIFCIVVLVLPLFGIDNSWANTFFNGVFMGIPVYIGIFFFFLAFDSGDYQYERTAGTIILIVLGWILVGGAGGFTFLAGLASIEEEGIGQLVNLPMGIVSFISYNKHKEDGLTKRHVFLPHITYIVFALLAILCSFGSFLYAYKVDKAVKEDLQKVLAFILNPVVLCALLSLAIFIGLKIFMPEAFFNRVEYGANSYDGYKSGGYGSSARIEDLENALGNLPNLQITEIDEKDGVVRVTAVHETVVKDGNDTVGAYAGKMEMDKIAREAREIIKSHGYVADVQIEDTQVIDLDYFIKQAEKQIAKAEREIEDFKDKNDND